MPLFMQIMVSGTYGVGSVTHTINPHLVEKETMY